VAQHRTRGVTQVSGKQTLLLFPSPAIVTRPLHTLMKKLALFCTLLMVLCCGTGCMSTIAHVGIHNPFPAEGVYPGVRLETGAIQDPGEGPFIIFYCLDLPLTAVLDTLFVPIDLIRTPDANPEEEFLRRINEEVRKK